MRTNETVTLRPALQTRGMAILAGLLILATGTVAQAATSGVADVNLEADATATITIGDASITLSPGQSDYEAGFIAAEGAAGIAVDVQTNSSTGMILYVKCLDGVPEIALADMEFRTQTAAGGTGSTQSSYVAVTGVDQMVWTSDQAEPSAVTVDTDIKVNNLWSYSDADGGGATTFTNQLTFSVAVQ